MNASMFASALGFSSALVDDQSDLSRLTNTLRAVIEVTDPCWRADECELAAGVRIGIGHVAAHCQRQSELSEQRVRFS
jgi:sorting nexin-8